jgi:hypothetical protein
LVTDATNFSRTATLQAPKSGGAGDDWQTIAAGTLSRFAVANLTKNDVSLELRGPQRHERYRLVLENRDSPPLDVKGVNGRGPVYQLVFLATPDQKLTLEYGSPEAQPGSYDAAALQASLAGGISPTIAKLTAAVENTAAPAEAPFRWSQLLDDSRVLFGGIALLTAILAFGLYRASRRLESTPKH